MNAELSAIDPRCMDQAGSVAPQRAPASAPSRRSRRGVALVHTARAAVAAALAILSLATPSETAAQARARTPQVEVKLLPETRSVHPGEPFRVAIRFAVARGWHVYWTNPGESGLPTEVRWELPRGFGAGDSRWTHPERLEVYSSVVHAYRGEAVVVTEIRPPPRAAAGGRAELRAHLTWGVCREVCIPQEARVSVRLPVRASTPRASRAWRSTVMPAEARLPEALPGWRLRAWRTEGGVVLRVLPAPGRSLPPGPITFFPADGWAGAAVVAAGAEGGVELSLRGAKPGDAAARLRGVLVAPSGWGAGGRVPALLVDVPLEGAEAP